MMQNNLKSSRSFQLNDLIEHQQDRKLPSALIHPESANTHEYFIKLLLFKYKSGQNALLLLTANADGTQCCRTALLSCVRQQSHQLQKPLIPPTFISMPTLFNTAASPGCCYTVWVKERFTALYLP